MSVVEHKEINGKMHYRFTNMPMGTYYPMRSKIDVMLDYVQAQLNIRYRLVMLDMLQIPDASVCRVRSGRYPDIPLDWLVKMQDFSGIPIDELRQLADLPPALERHPYARE
jgi:hypothetical protein